MSFQVAERRPIDSSSEPEEEDNFSLQGENVTPHLVAGTNSQGEPNVQAADAQPTETLSPAEIEKVCFAPALVIHVVPWPLIKSLRAAFS